jgi:hypothetical protein
VVTVVLENITDEVAVVVEDNSNVLALVV